MSLKNRVAHQMDSSVFSLRNPWFLSFLIPIFTLVCGDLTVFIIVSLFLGSSAFLFLTHSKHEAQVIEQEKQSNYDLMKSDQSDSNQESIVENEGFLEVGSPDSSSDSDVIDRWHYSGDACRRSDCSDGSDGSISDDESLIEIELFGGWNKDYKDEEEPKICRRQKSPDSVLWWPEEENMIEIDLSVGSIKCSRIEIKA